MRVHVVSDVHGNVDALARAADGADALVVLGDLIDFVDYHDHSRGILGAVFGPEKVATFARLRRERRHSETAAYASSLWASLTDPASVVEEAVREQYAKLFAAMPTPTYATPGNVDVPDLWPEFAGEGVRICDGEVVEIGGLRFGFVGGGLLAPGYHRGSGRLATETGVSSPHPESNTVVRRKRTSAFRPYLRSDGDMAEAVRLLPELDVLCSHVPPDVPELTYDVVARRFEFGSSGLLERIRTGAPRWAVFGHVHQPLTARMRVGRTECVNVGHFQRTERAYVLTW